MLINIPLQNTAYSFYDLIEAQDVIDLLPVWTTRKKIDKQKDSNNAIIFSTVTWAIVKIENMPWVPVTLARGFDINEIAEMEIATLDNITLMSDTDNVDIIYITG